MPSKVQLIGGLFQDSKGVALANGYLKFKLSQDGTVAGVGNVCAGIEIVIKLDASGSVDTSTAQFIWGNDQILPVNNFYKVTGYTSQGQPAWGPNNQQVTGSGGTFDVGTWIPNQVFSWSPAAQGVVLKTDGVVNPLQGVLNLISGMGISLSASGSDVTISTDGFEVVDITSAGPGGTYTLSATQAKKNIIRFSDNGTLTGTVTVVFPALTAGLWLVENFTNAVIKCITADAGATSVSFFTQQLVYAEGSVDSPGIQYVFTPRSYSFSFPYIQGLPAAGLKQTVQVVGQQSDNAIIYLSGTNGGIPVVYCDVAPTSNQSFLFEASTNGGATWTTWVTLTILAGQHFSSSFTGGGRINGPQLVRVTLPNPQDATMAGVVLGFYGAYSNLPF